MKLKNSRSESKNTFDKIQKVLATHGAKKIMFEYGQDGKIYGLVFELEANGVSSAIKLPARVENVAMVMYGKKINDLTDQKCEQAYRTAWANIRDWIDSQMALLDTRMVKIEEIFLPYFFSSKSGKTFFEHIEQNKQLLLSMDDEANSK